MANDKLLLCFFSVGNGHSTYIVFPNGQNALIDINTSSGNDNPIEILKSFNVTSLTYLIITHPHQDHITGLTDLVKKIYINRFICPPVIFKPDPIYDDWETYERLRTSPLFSRRSIVSAGHHHTIGGIPFSGSIIGGVQISYLAPPIIFPRRAEDIDVNDESLMVRLMYGRNKIIICGDTQESGWRKIPDLQIKNTTLLLASHHGNNSGYFLDKVSMMSPQYVVISAGEKTEYDADSKYRHHTQKWDSPRLTALGVNPPQRVFSTRTSGVLAIFNQQALESIKNV